MSGSQTTSADAPRASVVCSPCAVDPKAELKKREFRKYLVESGTLESVLKYAIGLMEAGQAPEDPQELLVRFFELFEFSICFAFC